MESKLAQALDWVDKNNWALNLIFYAYMFTMAALAELNQLSILLLCLFIPCDMLRLYKHIRSKKQQEHWY